MATHFGLQRLFIVQAVVGVIVALAVAFGWPVFAITAVALVMGIFLLPFLVMLGVLAAEMVAVIRQRNERVS